jgi:predicted nucleic acid-binding protein
VTIVVDASVAVKWFLPEVGHAAARAVLSGHEPLVAPALIRVEVSAAFLRRLKKGELPEDETRLALQAWEHTLATGSVRLFPDDELYEEAVHCAFKLRHDLPDCLYIVLARKLDASMVTADRPLLERGRKIHPRIALLEGTNPN